MKTLITIFVSLLIVTVSNAQSGNSKKIPFSRLYFHESIESTQKKILNMDYVKDALFTPTTNEFLNQTLTKALTEGVNKICDAIEADTSLDNNNKIKFLRGLNETLNAYRVEAGIRNIKYAVLPDLLKAFRKGMEMEKNGVSIVPLIQNNAYAIGDILMHTVSFSENPGAEEANNLLVLKYCSEHKDKALEILSRHQDLPFVDSMVAVIARYDPEGIYNYSAATTSFATKINNNPDRLVKTIKEMANSKSGRQYFPFLDEVYQGNLTLKEIDAVMDDDVKYYRLLVKTAINYTGRMNQRDTPMGVAGLRAKLQMKAIDPFINTINGLHESPNSVRFRILQPLTAQELYYLAITGEELIYTSSYVSGVYPRIWQTMKHPKSDSLLMSVRFDHFKKWIKMASNYNTLDDFLKRMDKQNAQMLMKAFVSNLDKTGDLEDAVDVANSYASITDKDLRKLIMDQINAHFQVAKQEGDERATDIYFILKTLFTSMDTTKKVDVSKLLGIPPAYYMPSKNLKDSAGRIVVQQFFYGDKDGKTVFNGFVNSMNNANWKITSSKYWVAISSTRGTPVTIYANRPLDETQNLDAKAQAELNTYLANKAIEPTVVIHRGHSYWLPATIQQLVPSAEVVMLGSCGAYQSLDKILSICPTAQIVASKQTGSGLINHPMVYNMLEMLRQGKDLNWILLWDQLHKRLGKNELFDDYVPPQKNLGALFLMAYKKLQDKRIDDKDARDVTTFNH